MSVFIWLVLRAFTRDRLELKALPQPRESRGAAPQRSCDIIMKGGITSGIVYPRAVSVLSREYRFVNVGGASAGAIAAGATAAAEYARARGRDAFAVLEQLPAWLGRGGRLFGLFQPNDSTRGAFEVFVAFLGRIPLPLKAARAFATAVAYFPLAFVAGLAVPAWLAWQSLQGPAPAWGVTGAVVTAVLLVPLLLVVGLVARILRVLPKNGFGLSSGHMTGQTLLSAWLDGLYSSLSGVTERPLTFGDLWTARDGRSPIGLKLEDRDINFEALTTSLSEGRPYRLPDPGRTFYFVRSDLERVLPERVVDWLVKHPAPYAKHVPGFHALPAAYDLPVVLAVRLSLSFPFLLSAVRFFAFDYTEDNDTLHPCWLSDGGISSNFPIHFFDSLVPSRPTFGLDLGPFHPRHPRAHDEALNVFLPQHNNSGHAVRLNRIDGVGGFIGSLINAMQAFMDNLQMRSAGYRDRVARIFLDDEEGGLNLTMPPELLSRLGDRGAAAGEKIIERFVNGSGWDNHRWVRMRSLMAMLQPQLRGFSQKADDEEWDKLFAAHLGYSMSPEQVEQSKRVIAALKALGKEWAVEMNDTRAPSPAPQLRGTPRV
ncbi:MAG: patatin-like phospholipase family protein [Archangiaceae bacterium]|nr:patatin-like phospholipase family protein [Archangiaceae bacterium]